MRSLPGRLCKLSFRSFSTVSHPLRIIKTLSDDPFFNLAYEEHLYNSSLVSSNAPIHTLFLWCNKPSIIIGRFQNPYKECYIDRIQQDNVELVRRKSGGGAVYQDYGNSIFSFIGPNSKTATQENNKILLNALKHFNIEAEPSGRNDIVVEGKKISGSAFKKDLKKNLLLHHGTILIDLDMNALGRYLSPHKLKLASKGVSSVQSRVLNLKERVPNLSHETWSESLINSFLAYYGCGRQEVSIETVNQDLLSSLSDVRQVYNELKAWEWRFGKTPDFTHNLETRFDFGLFDFYIQSENGLIKDVKIFSDCLYPVLIETLMEKLKGVKYDAPNIEAALKRTSEICKEKMSVVGMDVPVEKYIQQLSDWLIKEL